MGLSVEGDRSFTWDNEEVLEMNGGDGCPITYMYLMPLNWMLKNC